MLKTYLILIAATIFEVSGTMLLPVTKGFTKPLPTGALIFFYVCAFFCLSIVVTKLPLAVVYATWCGLGIFTIAIRRYTLLGGAGRTAISRRPSRIHLTIEFGF